MAIQIFHYSDLENAFDSPERVAQLVGLIDSQSDDTSLVVGAGDSLSPSVLSLITDAEQTLDVFEALDPVAETFGNHDFDLGLGTLVDIVEASPQTWVNTNLEHEEKALANADACPYRVVQTGVMTVGILGVTTQKLPAMNHHARNIQVRDPVEAIEDHTTKMRADHDVDGVVVLSHLGTESTLAKRLDTPVDAILGGHNHDPMARVVNGVAVARPGANGTHVTKVQLGDSPVVKRCPVDDGPPHRGIQKTLQQYIAEAGLDEVIATVSAPISLTKAAGAQGESRIGNFVTDAYRQVADADVAVLAARAIRTGDTLAGNITPFELINIAPFNDDLVVLELSGSELRKVFEELAHEEAPTMREWYFGHVSGAELRWDMNGSLEQVRVEGETLDSTGIYEVATSSYFVETDHIFTALDAANVSERVCPQYDALIEYAREYGVSPEVEDRIIRPEEY